PVRCGVLGRDHDRTTGTDDPEELPEGQCAVVGVVNGEGTHHQVERRIGKWQRFAEDGANRIDAGGACKPEHLLAGVECDYLRAAADELARVVAGTAGS